MFGSVRKESNMRVLVSDSTKPGHKQMFDISGALDRITDISEDHLREQLREFLGSLSMIMSDLPVKCGLFNVAELQVVLQISASGGIELVGKVSAGISGGITIRLMRDST
jgi:hypothetical protein